MTWSDLLGYPLIGSIIGSFLGFLTTMCMTYLQNKRTFRYHQLDKFYGPIYALIQQYQIHRKSIEDITKNIWNGELKDFRVYEGPLSDDYEVMAKNCADKGINCSARIFELITSSIMYARSDDIAAIEVFVEKYCDFVTVYGSSESPPYFQNYLDTSEVPSRFIHVIQRGYEQLISKIK